MTSFVVVPCHDEADRLDADELTRLADLVGHVTVVDDGSTDGTAQLLASLGRIADMSVLTLARNEGKAEAVRRGMLDAIDRGATVVGYLDADLATPVDEMVRLISVLESQPNRTAVLGSRVALLGHTVERRPARHYLGRVYATAASLTLGVPVYDTQCGAKVFRVGAPLQMALAAPFPDRWAFDVELLGRILADPAQHADPILEVPLHAWHDIGGSGVGLSAGVRAALSLVRLRRRIRRHRQRFT